MEEAELMISVGNAATQDETILRAMHQTGIKLKLQQRIFKSMRELQQKDVKHS
jgi:hypothetical protein